MKSALFLIVLLIVAGEARAQPLSTLTGTVKDVAGAAIAGATLTLEHESLPGATLTARTTVRGSYRFQGLPAGLYVLTAMQPGMQTVQRSGLLLGIGSTMIVDLVLASAPSTDIVKVTGAGPMVDVASALSTTRLTADDLMNLPIERGAALLLLVPGVTPRSVFGSGIDGSQLTVDGGPASVGLRSALQSAEIHPYWIEDVQVVGPSATAEYGESGGLIANIALKSGANRMSGLFEYQFSPSGWVADNTGELDPSLQATFQAQEILSRWSSHAYLGGPIARGRLFYFGGFDYARNKVVQAGTIGNVPFDERKPVSLGKVSWAPRPDFRLHGFIQADWTREVGALGRNALPETANDRSWQTLLGNASAVWTISPQMLLELRAGGEDFTFNGIPEARRAGPAPHRDVVTGIRSGNVQRYQDIARGRYTGGATVTRMVDGTGRHALKAGIEIEHATHHNFSAPPGGQSFTDRDGVPELVQLWEGDEVNSSGTRVTAFLQDSWSAGSRLTIHPGIRVSVNRGSVPDKGVVFRTTPFSPRLGIAWDVSADHRTVVRANYTRMQEGLYPQLFDFMNTTGRTPMITARVVAPDTYEELNRTTVSDRVAIDDALEHTYVDQYVVGAERQLFADVSLVVQYLYRDLHDVWAMTDTGSRYERVFRRDPGPNGVRADADDGELIEVFNLLNPGEAFTTLATPADAWRRSHAFQVIGQKRLSRNWQALGSYTWSRTRGNLNAVAGENRASPGTDTGPDNVFFNPNRRINATGRTAIDYTHQAQFQAVYVWPAWGGLSVSANYHFQSGGAAGRTATMTGLQQGNQPVRIEPRGTRQIDSASALDMRVEKTVPLRRLGGSLGIYVDLLNLTNEGVPFGLTIEELSGATFGEPLTWADPRAARIALRLLF